MKLSEELRGILNASHVKSEAFVIRTEGDRKREPRNYSTWCAKAVALIGSLQGDDTAKGYTLEDCEPKFRRYLQKTQFEPLHPSQINENNELEQNFEPSQPVSLPSDPSQTDRPVTNVTGQKM